MFCGAEEGILNFTEELTIYDDSVHIHQKVAEHVLLIIILTLGLCTTCCTWSFETWGLGHQILCVLQETSVSNISGVQFPY